DGAVHRYTFVLQPNDVALAPLRSRCLDTSAANPKFAQERAARSGELRNRDTRDKVAAERAAEEIMTLGTGSLPVRRRFVQRLRNTRMSRRLRMSSDLNHPRAQWPPASHGARGMEVDRIAKAYGDEVALADVSFQVAPGEIIGIIGP